MAGRKTGSPPKRPPDSVEFRRLRAALESVGDFVYAVDRAWRFVLFNRSAEEFFGRKRDEVLGRSLWEVFPQGRGAEYERQAKVAMDQRKAVTWEARSSFHPERTVELRMSPLEGGGIVVAIRDISLRKAAESALRGSERRLSLATDASELGVWEWRLDREEMTLSARARQIYGLGETEVVTNARLLAATLEADRAARDEETRAALDPAIRRRGRYEYRIVRPDGAVRWVRAHGEAVFSQDPAAPRAIRYVGAVEDITDQKLAEEDLSQSEARLRLAVDAGRMAVWEISPRTGQATVSPELKRILGFSETEDPDLAAIQARYAPGEMRRMQTVALAALQKGRYFEIEFRYLWPSGETRWLLVRAELLTLADGTIDRAIGVMMDVTHRRRDEERLRLLAREVDHRANNLLTVVQGMVAMTKAGTAEGMKEALSGRIAALARAHQLLAKGRWQGADLRLIAQEELAPYEATTAGRVMLSGDSSALTPGLAQSVAMVLHELATNAVKYGSLSQSEGRVTVAWDRDPASGSLVLDWTESGGPAVATPGRRGLGMSVIERALDGVEGGRTVIEWRPEGLHCRLELPGVLEEDSAA